MVQGFRKFSEVLVQLRLTKEFGVVIFRRSLAINRLVPGPEKGSPKGTNRLLTSSVRRVSGFRN